jgi:hypothetical protein
MTEIHISRRKFLKIFGAGIAVLAFGVLSGFELLSRRLSLFHEDKSPTTTRTTTVTTTPLTPSGSPDKFGIHMLFATMPGGREWFMNMDDPNSDGIFEARNQTVSKMHDGYWYAGGNPPDHRTRIMIKSPQSTDLWKNVEMTGYFKVVRTYPIGSLNPERENSRRTFQAYARGGTHSNILMADSDGKERYLNALGSAYKGRIHFNGDASVTKEVGHSVYATTNRHRYDKASGQWIRVGKSLFKPLTNNYNGLDGQYYGGRWIGLKVVISDFVENGKECARIQTYIDDYPIEDSNTGTFKPGNRWHLLSDVVDKGDWIVDPAPNSKLVGTLDKLIERCGNPFPTREDYARNILTWFGHPSYINDPRYRPIANAASFRWDFCGAEFAYLSVREIGGIR